jgi:hypothetical protein
MVDYDILDSYGTNRDMIRAVFTAKSDVLTPHAKVIFEKRRAAALARKREETGDEEATLKPKEEKALKWKTVNGLWRTREAWRKKIDTRIQEGLEHNVKHYRFYTAADMAWDSTPIHPEAIPLNLYAQGKIDLDKCLGRLKDCFGKDNEKKIEEFLVKDPNDPQKVVGMDLPRLHHTIINIIRPLVTRRLAAQVNKYNNLYPYLKYDTRDKKPVSRLRGDVMSQRAEIMTDNFGYKNVFTQAMRKALLHGHALVFPESSWEKHYEMRKNHSGDEDSAWTAEKVLTKEGQNLIIPHPNRTFYDLQYAPSTFNTDTGCRWAGYWDVDRLRNLTTNPMYYNTKEIRVSESFINRFVTNREFSACNFNKTISLKPQHRIRHDQKNDRSSVYWIDAQNSGDTEVVVTTYYEKIIPKDEGLGDYPFPVWIRLLVVDDDTVIFGEIMPSRPCAHLGYNEDDTRVVAQSMAHELMPYQDQMSNFFSQMLYLMKLQSFLLLMVDTDMIPETQRTAFKNLVKGNQYFANPALIEWSASEYRETFQKNPDNPMKFIEPQIQGQINELMRGVTEILALAEKNQIMSPQELGQFNQRETSATEVAEVTTTTNAMFSFISEGADNFRAALKQMIYEATVAKGDKSLKVPVVNTYPEKVVEAAGFTIDRTDEVSLVDEEEPVEGAVKSETSVANEQALQRPNTMTVIGSREALVHNYIFTSRDGSERSVNVEASKTLVQMLQIVGSQPAIIERIGQDQLLDMIQEIFRLSGSSFILEIPEDPAQGGQSAGLPSTEEIVQAVQQIGQAVGANSTQLQAVGGAVVSIMQAVGAPAEVIQQLATQLQPAAQGGAAQGALPPAGGQPPAPAPTA